MSSLFLVFRHAAGRALRGRRGIALIILSLIPPLIAYLFVAAHRSEGEAFEPGATSVLIMMALDQFVIPFAALLLGVAVLGDEIEGRTLTYMFTRPLARPLFYIGRLLGSIVGFGIVLALTTWFVAAHLEFEGYAIRGTIWIALAGFAAYTAFFAMLRAFLKHALYVGFLLAFIIEGVVSKLPASDLSKVSVWHHLALLRSRLVDLDTRQIEILRGIEATETVSTSWWAIAIVFVLSIAIAAFAVQKREVRLPAAVG